MQLCEFCNSSFVSTKALNQHQKTSKNCIEKQNLGATFICTGCNNVLITKRRFQIHQQVCKEFLLKKQKEIHDSEINKYKKLLTEKDNIHDLEIQKYKKLLTEKEDHIKKLNNDLYTEEEGYIIY